MGEIFQKADCLLISRELVNPWRLASLGVGLALLIALFTLAVAFLAGL